MVDRLIEPVPCGQVGEVRRKVVHGLVEISADCEVGEILG